MWQSNLSLLNANSAIDGVANSQKLVANYLNSPLGTSLKSANEDELQGYSDWFIPTINANDTTELEAISLQVPARAYWSSFEEDGDFAKCFTVVDNSFNDFSGIDKDAEMDFIFVREEIIP